MQVTGSDSYYTWRLKTTHWEYPDYTALEKKKSKRVIGCIASEERFYSTSATSHMLHRVNIYTEYSEGRESKGGKEEIDDILQLIMV